MFYYLTRASFLGVLCCIACSPYKVKTPGPSASIPDRFSLTGESATSPQWWLAFQDPALNQLIEEAGRHNTSIRAAWARLEAAEAIARANRGNQGPSLDASATASRAKTEFLGIERTTSQEVLGISASYEVDLWKRLSSRAKASLLEVDAAREDHQTIGLMMTASIATTYYTVIEQHQQKKLLEEQIAVNQQFLSVIEARFANGEATAVEVYQQRELLAASLAQMPAIEARLATSEHLLATLIGRAPTREWVKPVTLPELPALPNVGLPSDVLQRRPDVQAAMLRLEAADYRVAAAVADRYPSLRLVGNGSTDELFSNWLWSLAGSVMGPVFDSGRRKAEVDRNEALVKQQLALYEGAVLDALREVENGIVRDGYQREAIDRQNQLLSMAQAAYEASRARYLEGVGPFLTVLTELQAVQRIQRNLLAAQFEHTANRISLFQALGGHPFENPPVTSTPEPVSSSQNEVP